MKKVKLAFVMLPFASLILAGCSEAHTEPSGTTSHETGFIPPKTEIEEVVETVTDTLSRRNITFKMTNNSTSPGHVSTNNETREIDGNKAHVFGTSQADDMPPVNTDLYFEVGETNYIYQFDGDKWIKTPVPYTLITDVTESTYGFEEAMAKMKESYTKPSAGVYLLENFSYDVSVAKMLEVAGQSTEGYTLVKETITIHQKSMKITMSEGKLVSYEQSGYAYSFPIDEDLKTIDAIEMQNYSSYTKIYDIEKLGTTAVNLPSVE